MGWKEFFKPTLEKVLLTIGLIGFGYFIFLFASLCALV